MGTPAVPWLPPVVGPVRGRREIVDDADDLVPVLLVEKRGLEAEGVEEDPTAAAGGGLLLGRRQEARAVALSAEVPAHPQVLDLGAPRPGPAVESRGDLPL